MPFEILRNDITHMHVDAIVNTANPQPVIGWGADAGIHRSAGPELLKARQKIGKIPVGGAAITPGFRLPARYVIHAVGPVWQGGGHGEEKLLKSCYTRALNLAREQGCASIAFPLISAGNHGFPKPLALQTAMSAISEFLMEHEMQVYLVVFSRGAFQLSEKLFNCIASYIDENYILEANLKQYGLPDKCDLRHAQQTMVLREQMRRRRAAEEEAAARCCEEVCMSSSMELPDEAASPAPVESLQEFLQKTDAGFTETLLSLIDHSGKKDSEIYKRANISKQHFSKIRSNPHYKPTKPTALAFAIALELDLEQTRDLIGRAGFALTASSKFDLIIMYFIRERNYNMFDINAALFEFDQSLLGT